MKIKTGIRQRGLGLMGLIFILAILGAIGILGLRVAPTVTEYMSIKKAIVSAKASGTTPREIEAAFDRQADVSYIDSIAGKDLQITRDNGDFDVSFAYEKKIHLGGPVSLVIDYAGSTVKNPTVKGVD